MEGLRVIELGAFIVGPSAGAVLADWGADVIKIEGPEGDPSRAWAAGINPWFELDNRGKRSVTLDLKTPLGRRIVYKILESADLFLTNLRLPALETLGLDSDTLTARYPRLIYLSITGYGSTGPDRDKAAYDAGAFWSRSGAVLAMTPEGGDFPTLAGGTGDHMTAMTAVAGGCAALWARDRTGRGQHVTTSLLRTGLFMIGCDLINVLRYGERPLPRSRSNAPNPLYNTYRTRDGKWLFLLGLQPLRHLQNVAQAIGLPSLVDDPRFTSMEALGEHNTALIEILEDAFLARSRDEWSKVLDESDVWWTPLQSPLEVVGDEQVLAAGGLVEMPTAEGNHTTVASPVDFLTTPWAVHRRAPEAGENTEEILLSLGYSWSDIAGWRDEGAFGN